MQELIKAGAKKKIQKKNPAPTALHTRGKDVRAPRAHAGRTSKKDGKDGKENGGERISRESLSGGPWRGRGRQAEHSREVDTLTVQAAKATQKMRREAGEGTNEAVRQAGSMWDCGDARKDTQDGRFGTASPGRKREKATKNKQGGGKR